MTGEFDARIVRKNDSEKGLFLTLEITGDDFYGAVSQFRPGTLLKLQYEELDGDTGAPKEQTPAPGAGQPDGGDADQTVSAASIEKPRQPVDGTLSPARPAKPHRKFSDLPLSQQCALRCADKGFQKWLRAEDAEGAAKWVRGTCGIDSRAQLDIDPGAAETWHQIESEFSDWLTTQAHGAHVR